MTVSKKKVILIKSNSIDRDIRIPKEIKTLNSAGYQIELLCWDRERKKINSEREKNYKEVSLKLKAPWGIKILPFLPIWWTYIFYQLLFTKGWDIVQVTNFDSVVPAIIASKLRRKPIIYEIVDVYVDIIILPKLIRNIGIQVDRFLMRFVNAVIVIDDNQRREFGGIPNSTIVAVYDTPPNTFNRKNIVETKNEYFTIYYAGAFTKARSMNLDKIVSAVKMVDNVRLVISGYGDQTQEIQRWADSNPDKISFLGFISHEEVFQWSCRADLLLVARAPSTIGNRYNCGSTVLRALMCGKPFLANKGTATADLIDKVDCGISVDAYNIEEIDRAITRLRDNSSLCQQYGENAKRAYEQQYKWEIMEQRMQHLYKELIG